MDTKEKNIQKRLCGIGFSSATLSPSTSEYTLKYFGIEIEKISDEKYILKQGNNQYIMPVKETFYPFEIIESFDVAQLKKFGEEI